GLASAAAESAEVRQLLLTLLDQPALRRDVLRSLRGAGSDPAVAAALLTWWDKAQLPAAEQPELAAQLLLVLQANQGSEIITHRERLQKLAGPRPKDEPSWRKLLAAPGDPVAGERVFFHTSGSRCASCHRVDGRGGAIGPDLSTIGRALSRERLIESILTPSK